MSVTRRQLLAAGVAGGAATSLGLSGCSGSGGSDASGETTIKFAWWGNDVRNKMTNKAIKAYMKENDNVQIKAQPGEWSSYWDKISTQVAGNNAPDVIQMDMAYISEYGEKNALLDLSDHVDTSKFTQDTADAGKINGKLYGVNTGINTLGFMVNPKVFKSAGQELPDDKTWTWDDYKALAVKITKKNGSGIFGTGSLFSDNLLQVWLRQHDKDLFTKDGKLGFTAADIEPYFDMMIDFKKAKAIPSASMISEDENKSIEQNLFAKGKVGLTLNWSNQLAALTKAAGAEVKLLRPPSIKGDAKDRHAWYKASMLWSASSRTKNPEAVGKLIDWWVNDPTAARICLDERGIPPNSDMVEAIKPKLSKDGKTVADFIDEIKPEISDARPPPPPGGGKIGDTLNRHQEDVLFGRAKVKDAAQKFVDEANSDLEK